MIYSNQHKFLLGKILQGIVHAFGNKRNENIVDYFKKHHRDLHCRVMHKIYIHPSNMKYINKKQNSVNSSRGNFRGKVTRKLTLLTQRDSGALK